MLMRRRCSGGQRVSSEVRREKGKRGKTHSGDVDAGERRKEGKREEAGREGREERQLGGESCAVVA